MPTRDRRQVLADAGLAVLAARGMRAVTHRAVDAEAGLPLGSCSNCFRSRHDLIEALGRRIFERLTPDEAYLEARAGEPPTHDQWRRLMLELFERARTQPDLHLALLELRLEATRRPELVDPLTAIVRRSFEADETFRARAGLSGDRTLVAMLHVAVGGLITEVLTLPDALGVDEPEDLLAELVDRIVGPGASS